MKAEFNKAAVDLRRTLGAAFVCACPEVFVTEITTAADRRHFSKVPLLNAVMGTSQIARDLREKDMRTLVHSQRNSRRRLIVELR
jgi:hypothetical protein